MSVLSMSQRASGPSRAAEQPSVVGWLRAIARYIPAEVLALYLILVGLFGPVPTTDADRNMLAAIFLIIGVVLVVALVWLGYQPGDRDTPEVARRKRAWLVGMGVVAFIAYAMATPGGFIQFSWLNLEATQWGAIAAAVLAVLLPEVAKKVGIEKGARKEQTIDFPEIPPHKVGDPPIALAITASSKLSVDLSAVGACTLDWATLTLTGPGACTVTAIQAGSDEWAPAFLTRRFTIAA